MTRNDFIAQVVIAAVGRLAHKNVHPDPRDPDNNIGITHLIDGVIENARYAASALAADARAHREDEFFEVQQGSVTLDDINKSLGLKRAQRRDKKRASKAS